jgi:hypothetical protein
MGMLLTYLASLVANSIVYHDDLIDDQYKFTLFHEMTLFASYGQHGHNVQS